MRTFYHPINTNRLLNIAAAVGVERNGDNIILVFPVTPPGFVNNRVTLTGNEAMEVRRMLNEMMYPEPIRAQDCGPNERPVQF